MYTVALILSVVLAGRLYAETTSPGSVDAVLACSHPLDSTTEIPDGDTIMQRPIHIWRDLFNISYQDQCRNGKWKRIACLINDDWIPLNQVRLFKTFAVACSARQGLKVYCRHEEKIHSTELFELNELYADFYVLDHSNNGQVKRCEIDGNRHHENGTHIAVKSTGCIIKPMMGRTLLPHLDARGNFGCMGKAEDVNGMVKRFECNANGLFEQVYFVPSDKSKAEECEVFNHFDG